MKRAYAVRRLLMGCGEGLTGRASLQQRPIANGNRGQLLHSGQDKKGKDKQ